jgi:hypothetical protein
MTQPTGKRRGHGEDSIDWDESRKRYIGAVDLGFSPAWTRIRKKVTGKTKVEVRDSFGNCIRRRTPGYGRDGRCHAEQRDRQRRAPRDDDPADT